jgi:YfiH family protein
LAQVRTHVTDRWGGVSAPPYDELNLARHVGDQPDAVTENRRRLAGRLGSAADRVVWMEQPHAARVAMVRCPSPGPVAGVDALVTDRAGLWLAVLVADCVPVLLADPAGGVAAAVHAGWRGVVAGVVPAALAVLREAGARADRMRVLVGPCIGPCCYEVGEEVAAAVAGADPSHRARSRTRTGRLSVDLVAAVTGQLADAAVRFVEVDGRCTADTADLYSYRRDGRTGRFAGVIGLTGGDLGADPAAG